MAISAKNFGFADRLPIRQKNFEARPTDPRSDADFRQLPILSATPIFPDCRSFSEILRFSPISRNLILLKMSNHAKDLNEIVSEDLRKLSQLEELYGVYVEHTLKFAKSFLTRLDSLSE